MADVTPREAELARQVVTLTARCAELERDLARWKALARRHEKSSKANAEVLQKFGLGHLIPRRRPVGSSAAE